MKNDVLGFGTIDESFSDDIFLLHSINVGVKCRRKIVQGLVLVKINSLAV